MKPSQLLLTTVLFFISFLHIFGQYSIQDSLRGSITPEREWWDLAYYHLSLEVHPEHKTIVGENEISFEVLKSEKVMQIDLQPPLEITKVTKGKKELKYERNGNVYYIYFPKALKVGKKEKIRVYYEGKPKIAIRPPWDGGLTFDRDSKGNHFIATSCQGLGASVWWPCKDHMYDEPEGMKLSVTVPKGLKDVSNGQLIKVDEGKRTSTYHWEVKNPINNYGVNINIGDYAHWSEIYQGENGPLKVDYYPLKENLEKAKKQWKEVPLTIEAFEYWFGPYPFYEDGFKLVEAPYLGMEHQSSVTYGNGYQNGYRGYDLSGTGNGLLFDFIIVHESGHEWFANNITYKDIADMWVHEGFTNYSESLFLEYHFGKKEAYEYVRGLRKNIMNDRPIIGDYGVNNEGSSDMYYKGSNMLHTLRQLVNDDDKWRAMLRGLNQEFYHKTTTSTEVEKYMAEFLGLELQSFFDQYLRDYRLPRLEYYQHDGKLFFRWNHVIENFEMPIYMTINGEKLAVEVNDSWNSIEYEDDIDEFEIDPNFYISYQKIR